MKTTGFIRKMDNLGRIVIPIEIRNKFKISEKDSLEIFSDSSSIIFKKLDRSCIICGKKKNLIDYNGKNICSSCIENISKMHI